MAWRRRPTRPHRPRSRASLLQWDQVLGRGAFKVVYKAFDTQEGALAAASAAASILSHSVW